MATQKEWKLRFAKRLHNLREIKGLTQAELAAALSGKVGVSAISNYEQGTRLPELEVVMAIAKVLGESPAHVLCLDDDMPALSASEAKLIRDLRTLPENLREESSRNIATLATAYKRAVSPERLGETEYAKRPRRKAKETK